MRSALLARKGMETADEANTESEAGCPASPRSITAARRIPTVLSDRRALRISKRFSESVYRTE